MTRTTNARLAGVAYLAYIAVALPGMLLLGRATGVAGIAAKLARIAEHASDMRLAALLSVPSSFAALVLAVTLYAITRDEDPDVALLALTCRVAEGVLGGSSIVATLGLLWVATAAGPNAPDAAGASALAGFLLEVKRWNVTTSATFFALGSTLFSWLLLRGRIVPVPLATLGVIASVIVLVGLPLELVGLLRGPVVQWMWYPMLAFEVPLGVWLLVKGAAPVRQAL
jgi:hypothetical protein